MSVVRSHLIRVLSKYKTSEDSNYQYRITIPDNGIKCDNPGTQDIKMRLVDFTIPFSWPLINSANNTIIFTDNVTNVVTTIALPNGNWIYEHIAQFITSNSSCTCTWIIDTNRLTFVFTNPTTISFTGTSYNTFGFSSTDLLSGTVITSTQVLNEKFLNNIYVNLEDIVLANDGVNFDNVSGEFNISNGLGVIPVVDTPWGVIKFANGAYANEFTVTLNNEKLNNFTLALVDSCGNYLTYLPDWEAVIKVEICDKVDEYTSQVVSLLSNINQQIETMALSTWISAKERGQIDSEFVQK